MIFLKIKETNFYHYFFSFYLNFFELTFNLEHFYLNGKTIKNNPTTPDPVNLSAEISK